MDTNDVIRKYRERIESSLDPNSHIQESHKNSDSKDYSQFKKDMLRTPTRYERWCKSLGNIINIKVAEKDRVKVEKFIEIGHLDVTPNQTLTLAAVSMFTSFFFFLILSLANLFLRKSFSLSLIFIGLLVSLFVLYYTYTMPQRLANQWRMKASSQMVPAILYIVIYMKHTSNLERAIEFASQHLEGPLAMDLKKIFYDIEVGKYSTIKQSLDSYLESWRDYAPEFVESFHLIESSLYEPTESRRVEILEKALQIILEGIYEKMLKYSREIRSPITNLYMLGIILPTLCLAMLPLASTLLGGSLTWIHVFFIFNVLVPFMVFYMASEALLKRPGGYGEAEVLEMNPDYKKYTSSKPYLKATLIALPFILIGLIPFIFQIDFLTNMLGLKSDYTFEELGITIQSIKASKIFEFMPSGTGTSGPFGLIGIIFSFFIPIGITIFFATAFKLKTKDMIVSREKTKSLEAEFNNSIFQLGNRLGDGVPAEIAFGKIAELTKGQSTSEFFSIVNMNIQQAGMSVDSAIFDRKRGAITYFPSSLISTSMKILVESVKKGLQIAARSLMSIAEYVKNIQKINQRLKDLLAEIVSDMKSNMTFLAPMLSGIVVGLSAMITLILIKLQGLNNTLGETATENLGGIMSTVNDLFDIQTMIPPYLIQLTIGLYIIEIVFILTYTLVTIDAGRDPLKEKYEIAKNLVSATTLYIIVAFFATLILSLVAISVLKF